MNAEWNPLVICVAPNGAYKTKRDHPALPLSAAELARTAAECRAAGAAMVHLHVRDSTGRHSLDPDIYREAIAAVRREVGAEMVIQVTSEAAQVYGPEQQMAAVRELRPESVSVAVREIVPDAAAEPAAAEFLAWAAGERIMVQFILYSSEDLARYRELQRRGIVPAGRHPLLYVLGRYSSDQRSRPIDLLPFLVAPPSDEPWSVCAFGPLEHACGIAAATFGGHVRVGFENNLQLKDGGIAPSNAALVAQVRDAAGVLGRPLASADAVRELFAPDPGAG